MLLPYILHVFFAGARGEEGVREPNALYLPIRDPFSWNPARQRMNVALGTVSPGFRLGGVNYGI